MLTRAMIVEKMERYLEGNIEEARDIASQINGYDESLGWLYVYSVYEFDYVMECAGIKGLELACKLQFGNFSVNHDYFKFDGLGNIEGYYEFEYEELIKDNIAEIVERYIELAGHVYADAEMEALMEAYEEAEE